jgi:hypothetical protein
MSSPIKGRNWRYVSGRGGDSTCKGAALPTSGGDETGILASSCNSVSVVAGGVGGALAIIANKNSVDCLWMRERKKTDIEERWWFAIHDHKRLADSWADVTLSWKLIYESASIIKPLITFIWRPSSTHLIELLPMDTDEEIDSILYIAREVSGI